MTGVVRVTVADADPNSWAAEPAPPPVRDDYTPEWGELSLTVLGESLQALAAAISEADTTIGDATRYLAESMDVEGLVQTHDMVTRLRKNLGYLEAHLARTAGQTTKEVQYLREGTLPDGRLYKVGRSKERKEWRHDGWKQAVDQKAIVAHGADGVVINADTSEVVDVGAILADAHAAHSSNPPKVGVLRERNIDPDDYCSSFPGPYTIRYSAPESTGS